MKGPACVSLYLTAKTRSGTQPGLSGETQWPERELQTGGNFRPQGPQGVA
jgi:hypothetical protein